jgi:hypothetical protein
MVFGGAARSLVSEADRFLPTINQLLTLIRKPAALAEATKIRDEIVEAREIFKPFVAP